MNLPNVESMPARLRRRWYWRMAEPSNPLEPRQRVTRAPRAAPCFFALVSIALQSACAPPIVTQETDSTDLRAIRLAFEQTVREAHDSADEQWHSGWFGNVLVNANGAVEHLGLCHHWQERVYAGVIGTVRKVGWEATGITINFGSPNEHHAVVVFDPDVESFDTLLVGRGSNEAWVLDAWKRGRADIFTVRDWVSLPLIVWTPPALEDLSSSAGADAGRPPEDRRHAAVTPE